VVAGFFLFEVEGGVIVEVSVAHEGAELEDGFGAVQAPPGAGGTLGIAGQCPAIADTQGGMRMYRPNYDDAARDDTERQERQERQEAEGGLPEDEDSSEREIAERDREERELESRPLEDNEAHAAGQVCARCGAVVTVSQDVRRRADGRWVHEVCPQTSAHDIGR
jgi:hypothetical protein